MRRAHRSGSNPPSGSDWVRYRSMSALGQKQTIPPKSRCPLCPPKQTLPDSSSMSAKCQKRTFCLWLRDCLMPQAGLWLARGFAVSIALL